MGDQAAPVGPAAGGEAKVSLVPVENPPSPIALANERRAARDAKIAASRAARESGATYTPPPPAPTDSQRVAETETTTPDAPKPTLAPKADEKPKDEAPDAQTTSAMAAIEKREKRAREQIAADRAALQKEIEDARADLARQRAELTGKVRPLEDLSKLPPAKRAIEALKLAGIDPDDEEAMEMIARDTYARSKSGKADPKNRAYADQLAEKRGIEGEIAELRKMLEETRTQITEREKQSQTEAFQNRYLDEAVKAIPSEPTFIARAHAANPQKARAELLAIGQHLEKQNGETPTHAEVIAEYERLARADLTDRGFSPAQITAILAPSSATPAKPAAAPAVKTLDPAVGLTTPTAPQGEARDAKIARARAARLKANVSP